MEIKPTSSDLSMEISVNLVRHKIVFVGDVSVGKTSIINRFIDNKFNEKYDPSVGVDFSSKTIKFRGKSLKLQLWDSAGQEKYKSLIPSYIRGASIIFVVYDITKRETFMNLSNWLDFIKNIENPIIVLCGNKLDLYDNRSVSEDESNKYALKSKILNFEVSAKSGDNMSKMIFYSIANLPFFEQYRMNIDEIVSELEIDNNENSNKISSNNISIINSSRGSITINRSEIMPTRRNNCKC